MGNKNSQVGPGRQNIVVMGAERDLGSDHESPKRDHHPIEPPNSEMKRNFDDAELDEGNGKKVA